MYLSTLSALGASIGSALLLSLKPPVVGAGAGDEENDGDDDDLTLVEHLLYVRLCARCFIWTIILNSHSTSV